MTTTAAPTRLAVLTGLFVIGALAAQARTIEVGADKAYKLPSLAAAAARDGDTVKIYPGEYFDCAVWQANKLVVEATGVTHLRNEVPCPSP